MVATNSAGSRRSVGSPPQLPQHQSCRFRFCLLGCKDSPDAQRERTENCLFLFFRERKCLDLNQESWSQPLLIICSSLLKSHFQKSIPGVKMSQKERGGSSSGPPPENLNQVKKTLKPRKKCVSKKTLKTKRKKRVFRTTGTR